MNERDEVIVKIERSSRFGYILSIIMIIVLIVGVVCNIVGIAAALKYPEKLAEKLPKLFSNITSCVIFIIAAMNVRGIFGGILKDGTPFRQSVVRKLRTVGGLFIITCIAPEFVGGVAQVAVTNGRAFHLSVETQPILIGAFILILAQIFSYGALLQQESDETV